MMIMNCEYIRICKEVVVACFNATVLEFAWRDSQTFCVKTTEIQTGYLLNAGTAIPN
jgi:hypothetical protein